MSAPAVMPAENSTLELLRQYGRMSNKLGCTPNIFALFAKHGIPMRPVRLTVAEARKFVKLARRRGGLWEFRPKECWFNAQSLALVAPSALEYYEGYISIGPVPIEHAWVTINGKLVDVTTRASHKDYEHHYVGVPVPLKLLKEHLKRARFWSPVTQSKFAERIFPEIAKVPNA